MRVTVNVTQADIDNGVDGDCRLCPVARALSRAGVRGWNVFYHGLVSELTGETIALPRSAMEFIRRFDSGGDVKPFSFELEIPA